MKTGWLLSASFLWLVLAVPAWADISPPDFTIAEWTEQFDVAHAAAVKSQQASEDYFAKNDIKAHCVADREFLFYFQRKLMISMKISDLVAKDSKYDDKSRKALAGQVESIKHGVKLAKRGVDLICGTDEEKAGARDDFLTGLHEANKVSNTSGEAHLLAGKEAADASNTPEACKEIRSAVIDFTTSRDGRIALLKSIGGGNELTPEEKASEQKYVDTLKQEIDGLQGYIDAECKSQ